MKMSLRTRIRGFTAWINLRLMPYNHLMSNVLMDLLSGTNMKYLVESFTGRDLKRLESMDGLSQQQCQTRVEWVLDELKHCNVLPADVYIDARMFAMRSADQVFDLLWRLISHDIWFVWERLEYLQHHDPDIITKVPFQWTPDPPPRKKKKPAAKKSLLSGFGMAATGTQINQEKEDAWVKYPNADFMKDFKKHKPDPGNYPAPDVCILEMVNTQLKKIMEGMNLYCNSIDDLVDSRVLCALVNSFVPGTFTTDLLLNDRWTINLALRTAEKMFYADTPFDSEDLAEADGMAVCAYFGFFFMVAFKYRQCKMAVQRMDRVKQQIRKLQRDLEESLDGPDNKQNQENQTRLKAEIKQQKEAVQEIMKRFDTEFCHKWVKHVQEIQKEIRSLVHKTIKNRFDFLTVPRNISISDLCLSYVINLCLTNGSGFILSTGRESMGEGRRVILHCRETGEFIDDFTTKGKSSIQKVLGLPKSDTLEIDAAQFPQYDIFFETVSRNKRLKAGTVFLYQVFPGNTVPWQRLFLKSARDNEYDKVERMIEFFCGEDSLVNTREPKTGYTALHWACRNGHFDLAVLLLENGADINSRNNLGCTPIFMAIEGLQRQICHLLIEWGCDMHWHNNKKLTPLEIVKNEEFRQFLFDLYERYLAVVPKIMNGNCRVLEEVVKDHISGKQTFCTLRSRCVNGSTLLHTACHYGYHAIIKTLLQLGLSVDLRDYKGASPLHRAKDPVTLQILLENGATIDAEDAEGNTPLHVKCYGETDQLPELESIELLLAHGADPTKYNHRGLLAIHCCAMQGRVDVMQLFQKHGLMDSIVAMLNSEEERSPPSLLHLAIANDFVECARWLVSSGFRFKDKESDILLRRILTEQIKISERASAVRFLMENGADPNPVYPGGNSALHYAASLSGPVDILETLLSFGADVDVLSDEAATPLFFATHANNQLAACVLISHGADVRQKNAQGLTAFDYITDFDEWIDSGYFNEEIMARLKAYSLKHARDLVHAISNRVKSIPVHQRRGIVSRQFLTSASSITSRSRFAVASSHFPVQVNAAFHLMPSSLPHIQN